LEFRIELEGLQSGELLLINLGNAATYCVINYVYYSPK
jgi:hypothetical protein